MKEFRITCPERYPPSSPGHRDPSARQGYYQVAESPHHAVLLLRNRTGFRDMVFEVEWPPFAGAPEIVIVVGHHMIQLNGYGGGYGDDGPVIVGGVT